MTWLLYTGRKSLGFTVSTELDFAFVWVEIDLISMWGIDLELISAGIGMNCFFVWGSKMTWFWGLDQTSLGYCVEASKLTLIGSWDRN